MIYGPPRAQRTSYQELVLNSASERSQFQDL